MAKSKDSGQYLAIQSVTIQRAYERLRSSDCGPKQIKPKSKRE